MDIPTLGLPIAHKLYPILLKYQMFVDEELKLLGKLGCIPESVSPGAALVIMAPKELDPLNPQKQQVHLVIDYQLLNESINAAHMAIV